jgi:SOS response regulatory protein OraA/RecX
MRADLEAAIRQLQHEQHTGQELQHRLQEAEAAAAQVSGALEEGQANTL